MAAQASGQFRAPWHPPAQGPPAVRPARMLQDHDGQRCVHSRSWYIEQAHEPGADNSAARGGPRGRCGGGRDHCVQRWPPRAGSTFWLSRGRSSLASGWATLSGLFGKSSGKRAQLRRPSSSWCEVGSGRDTQQARAQATDRSCRTGWLWARTHPHGRGTLARPRLMLSPHVEIAVAIRPWLTESSASC